MKLKTIVLSVSVAFILGLSGIFENEAMYGRIHADAQGYYGYLVAIFLEHSFDWERVIHSYADVYFDGGGADFTVTSDLGRVNKYYVGTAILILPFFLLSCLASVVFGFPVDGYSQPFQLGIMTCALFYAGLGMYLLASFLEKRGFSTKIALSVVVALLFGTGLFHYSISESAMSHVYSFSLFSMFLFSADACFRKESSASLLFPAGIFALIVLVRPANGLILFSIPFITGGLNPLKEKLQSETALSRTLLSAMALVFVMLSIQSFMYIAQVGKPFVWSYHGEGFNFLNPEIINVLFSFKKGFFVYSPIAFIGLMGLVWMLFRKPTEGAWLLAFLFLSVYVISCWWNWYYGGSLGMRALIEYLPFFAIGLAFLIENSGRMFRIGIATLILVLISVNLVQSYQYQKFILHWVDMDQERFWQVFMKTDRKYDGIFYREEKGIELPSEEQIVNRAVFQSDLEEGTTWGEQGLNTEKAFSGLRSSRIFKENPFGTTLGVPLAELGPSGPKKLLVSAQVWSEEAFPNLVIAYSYRNSTGDYGHDYIGVGQYVAEPGQWTRIEHIANINLATDSVSDWIVYPLNEGKSKVFVDDIRYEIITLNE